MPGLVAMHWLYGSRGAPSTVPPRPPVRGLRLGTTVWAASYAELIPLGAWPSRAPSQPWSASGLPCAVVFDSLADKLQGALGDLRKKGKLDEESISRAMREI